jgi:hypothetical protein
MHKHAKAWALISSGPATGQTHQQFPGRNRLHGLEQPAKLGQPGHQVSFNLAVVNDCTGARPIATPEPTPSAAEKIAAADVTRTG